MMVSLLVVLGFIYISSHQCLARNGTTFPEWMQHGISESDYQQIKANTTAEILDKYIFMNQSCVRETSMSIEVRNRTVPSRIHYRWPWLTQKNSFRTTSVWQDHMNRTVVYPHHQVVKSQLSPFKVFITFLGMCLCLLLFVILLFIPLAGLLFLLIVFLYFLITNRAMRNMMRSCLIKRQKNKRRLEIARTPDKCPLEPPYALPLFFRKHEDDYYPQELEEYDMELKRKHGRLPSEVNINDRFGNYMLQRDLDYDPLLHRFRHRGEAMPEDAKESAELRRRLKAQRIQQAREMLAQEEQYITNIPSYRIKAIELGIPYAEDEERHVVLTTLQKTLPKKKSKPSALDVTTKVIKKRTTPKVRPAKRNPEDVEAGPDSEPGANN